MSMSTPFIKKILDGIFQHQPMGHFERDSVCALNGGNVTNIESSHFGCGRPQPPQSGPCPR
jgi:hypothetical protein